MPTAVKARIVKIGNSQGIRIPKLLLEQANFGEEVELELQGEQLVIRPAHRARHNWAVQFKAMAAHGDDVLLDADVMVPTAWDEEEWEW
jgi:antitoxin MazE